MNVEEYISSGILEEYVVGTASEQERQEVECLSSIYPEIREELISLESSLERYAQLQAIEPSEDLKSQLMEKIDRQPGRLVKMAERDEREKKRDNYNAALTNWRFGAAAAVILLISATVWLFVKQERIAEMMAANENLKNQVATLQSEQQQNQRQLANLQSDLEIISHPAVEAVPLAGTENEPEARSLIYWNKESKQTFVKVENLPAPPEGKQYQLWALDDGTPIDAGVFEVGENTAFLQNLKEVENAQTFAVTLENRGGSKTPTLDAMYLMGNVKS